MELLVYRYRTEERMVLDLCLWVVALLLHLFIDLCLSLFMCLPVIEQ